MHQAAKPSGLTPDELQLWQSYHAARSVDVRNQLIERYLPLVKYNAQRIWSRLPDGVELDDLQQADLFGLIDAIEAFDVTRGVRFETYCVPRVRGAMLDELRAQDWVPRLTRSQAAKLAKASDEMYYRLGRRPTVDELAKFLDMPVVSLERKLVEANAVGVISLNKKWYETDSYKDVRELDILVDKKGEDPRRRMRRQDVLRLVTKGLNQNERLIVILYYCEDKTMKEIGATLGLSESRVSQMHSDVMARLKQQLGRRRDEFALER